MLMPKIEPDRSKWNYPKVDLIVRRCADGIQILLGAPSVGPERPAIGLTLTTEAARVTAQQLLELADQYDATQRRYVGRLIGWERDSTPRLVKPEQEAWLRQNGHMTGEDDISPEGIRWLDEQEATHA